MKIAELAKIINANILSCSDRCDMEVNSACGSDMMSDVLAYVKNQAVLLTGLVNPQVIRTANMMDMVCIVFVRGKMPTEEMIELASECGIAVIRTDKRSFETCGLLYSAGLESIVEG